MVRYPRAAAAALRVKEASPIALHHAVARGLRASLLSDVAALVGATRDEAAAVRRSVLPDSTWKRRKGKTLSPVESDRTARLARVTALALETWHGNLAAVREFLHAPHPELDGERPLDALTTDVGARLVEDVLIRLRHGLPV